MPDFVPFLFACSGLRCNTSREYQDTQLIHLVCMSVSFGFKPNLYICIVIYLYIYIHNDYCTVNNIIILLIIVNVYILCVIYGYFILLLSLFHLNHQLHVKCYTMYKNNIMIIILYKNIMKMIYIYNNYAHKEC